MPQPSFDSPEDGAEPHEIPSQTKKLDEPNPTNWRAEVPTLPDLHTGIPTISELLPAAMQDVSKDDFVNAEKAAAKSAEPTAKGGTQSKARSRYSFKNCGVYGPVSTFIKPQFYDKLYAMVTNDVFAVGKITEVPRGPSLDYLLNWFDVPTSSLPVKFDQAHLRTSFDKSSKSDMVVLKAARDAYDIKHPSKKKPLGNKKPAPKRKQAVDVIIPSASLKSLTSLRMNPSPSSGVNNVDHIPRGSNTVSRQTVWRRKKKREPPVDLNQMYMEDSDSDDGSDMEAGDTYLPIADDTDNVADSSYNPSYMETDGRYDLLGNVEFNYEPLEHPLDPPTNMYNGWGPCLKKGISRRFHTPFECVQVVGGLTYHFFKRITANSNGYARANMNNKGFFGGVSWVNISVQEMIRFHGVILRMSMEDRNLGGYEAYFTSKIQINCSRDFSVEVDDLPSWACKYFTLRRFKQIRAAYHPEVGASTIGDKCHQLQYAHTQ